MSEYIGQLRNYVRPGRIIRECISTYTYTRRRIVCVCELVWRISVLLQFCAGRSTEKESKRGIGGRGGGRNEASE